jgi:hypothetical protein
VSERDERFRRLRPSTRQTGDLFEHFGVEVERGGGGSIDRVPVRAAQACPTCGWYRGLDTPCDNCGAEASPP